MPKQAATITDDDTALAAVCGGEAMADRVKALWADIMEKKRLDVSDQGLDDDGVIRLLKGLHMMSKTTGFATERTKPFPITELNFSGNEITKVGIAAVVQFARTQGSDATHVDLSRNRLDDAAATDEVTRLVKNYSSFAANAFISTLILSGNNIGRVGATKLIQYAHWERDRFKTEPTPPPPLKLDLSDNCVSEPAALMEELKGKRIKLCPAEAVEADATVHLPSFTVQRALPPPPEKAGKGRGGGAGGGGGRQGGGGNGYRERNGGASRHAGANGGAKGGGNRAVGRDRRDDDRRERDRRDRDSDRRSDRDYDRRSDKRRDSDYDRRDSGRDRRDSDRRRDDDERRDRRRDDDERRDRRRDDERRDRRRDDSDDERRDRRRSTSPDRRGGRDEEKDDRRRDRRDDEDRRRDRRPKEEEEDEDDGDVRRAMEDD